MVYGLPGRADKDSVEIAYKAGIISREQYVVSLIDSYFTKKGKSAVDESLATGGSSMSLTMLLKEAVQNYMFYSNESRVVVDRFLLRPSESNNNWPWNSHVDFYLPDTVLTFTPSVEDYPHIGGQYTFWYVIHNTPDSGGHVHTASQSFVTAVAQAFETTYAAIVDDMGFVAPLSDLLFFDNGVDGTRDVYLMNCGFDGLYGYTMNLSDDRTTPSYIVLDNDFEEFTTDTTTAEQAMQVTVAHEFHHSVQFSMNSYADIWIMEATSCWMESKVYPALNDNIQYLNGSNGYFAMPDVSLDDDDQWYNSWIFLKYMTLMWGDQTVEDLWDYLLYSSDGMVAVSSVLSSVDSDLKTAFTDFVMKNHSQTGFYPDADDYDEVRISNNQGQILDYSSESSHLISTVTARVDHLAATYYKYIPGDDLEGERLLVDVYGEDGAEVQAALTVKKMDGSYTEKPFVLDGRNDGYLYVDDFSASSVDEVVVQVINYSTTDDNVEMIVSGGLGFKSALDGGGGGCFIDTVLN
jgi:hypothetical protein